MTLPTVSPPPPPLHCPWSCWGHPGLGWAFWCLGPWGAWVHCPGALLSLPYTLETQFRKKARMSGRAMAGVQALGPWGSRAAGGGQSRPASSRVPLGPLSSTAA